jgi:hypothetical protein
LNTLRCEREAIILRAKPIFQKVGYDQSKSFPGMSMATQKWF